MREVKSFLGYFRRILPVQRHSEKGVFLYAEKAAAEKRNAIVFELSEREKDLVRQLGM